MSYTNLKLDDHLLDGLVSGSLSPELYRHALLALEANPHRWRDCALAFLQEQAIASELQGLARSNVDWSQAVAPVVPTGEGALPQLGSAGTTSTGGGRRWGSFVVALAAMVLIGFGFGWLSADRQHQGQDASQPLARQTTEPESPTQVVRSRPTGPSDSERLTLPRNPSNVESSGMRLVSNDFMPIDREIPPELLELERRGRIRIETYDAMLPVDFRDGASALVPVQQFRIVPTAFSY